MQCIPVKGASNPNTLSEGGMSLSVLAEDSFVSSSSSNLEMLYDGWRAFFGMLVHAIYLRQSGLLHRCDW